uniref:U5 small nuclear ribonucleoprotein 40 kDa protein n=1 Tax=Panagrolaimus sp. ES5 TaxID=591445 RepID=A0AC34F414_9BILA
MTEVFKRPADVNALVPTAAKRGRYENVVAVRGEDQQNMKRHSGLQSPIMLLTGHEGEIYAAKFNHDGRILASAGFDMKIMFWNTYGDCENFSHIRAHKGAILDIQFSSDETHIYSASTDKTLKAWDLETGKCVRNFKTHTEIVNSCHPARRGPALILSGGDDGMIYIHDLRKKEPAMSITNEENYQILAVSFNDSSDIAFGGGIENKIHAWDLRKQEIVYDLVGHTDTITGLCLSPKGEFLLSNSMDNTVRTFDVRPFATEDRLRGVFGGHQHNFEKNLLKCAWSADSNWVTAGSSDRYSYVWDVKSKNILYKLPGHQGSVNATDFHPSEPILLSASSDKQIYLGELEP